MLDFEEIYEKVKNTLSEKRFYHSKCVMEACIELAKIYGEDVENAKIAGIVHDIAKEIPKEDRIKLADGKYGIKLDEVEKESKGLIHAKLGAAICEKDLGLSKDICEAVKYHTTAKENMTISLDRNYSNTEKARELAKENLDETVEFIIAFTIEERIKTKKTVHLDSVRALNYLIIKK